LQTEIGPPLGTRMREIRKLSEKTINQIAAGEVVDRPLSVIKELVENSLDAEAKSVIVEIERGGRNLISVADDGAGIRKEELSIAIERHATSKLDEEDIDNINFHGFRGEALPSIASVSELKIKSKNKHEDSAWEVVVIDGGSNYEIIPTSRRAGTVVEVRNLFCFTPNRLRFLKSEQHEVTATADLLQKFALVHPEVAFKLISDKKTIIDYPAIQEPEFPCQERIFQVLGKEFAGNSIPIHAEKDSIKIQGYISLPTSSRKATANYFIYVNRRIIKDRNINAVVKVAYQGLIPQDRFPQIALFIECSPYEVDVNIHPNKAEVRFRDEQKIKSMIVSAIRSAIATNNIKSTTNTQTTSLSYLKSAVEAPPAHYKTQFTQRESFPRELKEEVKAKFQAPIVNKPPEITPKAEEVIKKIDEKPQYKPQQAELIEKNYPMGFAKCQIGENYIIAEANGDMLIVDQHAAHERIVLEKMKKQLLAGRLPSQHLLLPEVIEIGAAATDMLLSLKEEIKKFGFSFDRNGLSQIIVREVPELFKHLDINQLFLDLVDFLETEGAQSHLEAKFLHVLSNIACKRSIRSGRKMTIEEMNALLREMETTPFSNQCNHGRPTFTKLSIKEIEKIFERS
jgi:DNA mismatch repair protein MutL